MQKKITGQNLTSMHKRSLQQLGIQDNTYSLMKDTQVNLQLLK